MDTANDSEHVGVSHLAGSLKEQRQNAIKVDVTADVLAERIKVGLPGVPDRGFITCSGVMHGSRRFLVYEDHLPAGCSTLHQDVQCNPGGGRISGGSYLGKGSRLKLTLS